MRWAYNRGFSVDHNVFLTFVRKLCGCLRYKDDWSSSSSINMSVVSISVESRSSKQVILSTRQNVNFSNEYQIYRDSKVYCVLNLLHEQSFTFKLTQNLFFQHHFLFQPVIENESDPLGQKYSVCHIF